MSRILLNALWRLDIPARKLQLPNEASGGHTMIEFYHNGKWRVLSPADNTFVWRTDNGEIASAIEIQDNPAIFSQVYSIKPHYPYRFDNYKHIRWNKLPNWLTSIIRRVIGENRFTSIETPRLYDLPRTLFLYCSILSSILLSIAAYVSRPRKRPLEEQSPMWVLVPLAYSDASILDEASARELRGEG